MSKIRIAIFGLCKALSDRSSDKAAMDEVCVKRAQLLDDTDKRYGIAMSPEQREKLFVMNLITMMETRDMKEFVHSVSAMEELVYDLAVRANFDMKSSVGIIACRTKEKPLHLASFSAMTDFDKSLLKHSRRYGFKNGLGHRVTIPTYSAQPTRH